MLCRLKTIKKKKAMRKERIKHMVERTYLIKVAKKKGKFSQYNYCKKPSHKEKDYRHKEKP